MSAAGRKETSSERELIKNEVLDEQSFKKLLDVKAICWKYTG